MHKRYTVQLRQQKNNMADNQNVSIVKNNGWSGFNVAGWLVGWLEFNGAFNTM